MEAGLIQILGLTLKVALCATLLVAPPAVFAGYALARWRFKGRRLLSALVGLPLVLPPTAVGFLLLRLLAYDGPLGRTALGVDLSILLTWRAAVLASAVMSLPLVARTARVTFEAIDPRLESMGRTLGYSALGAFRRVTLPLAARGLSAGVLLGFTRALGEFGATVTIAGNIPGRTQTLASAIFSAQQVGDHVQGRLLMLVALAVGLGAILLAESLAPRNSARRRR